MVSQNTLERKYPRCWAAMFEKYIKNGTPIKLAIDYLFEANGIVVSFLEYKSKFKYSIIFKEHSPLVKPDEISKRNYLDPVAAKNNGGKRALDIIEDSFMEVRI